MTRFGLESVECRRVNRTVDVGMTWMKCTIQLGKCAVPHFQQVEVVRRKRSCCLSFDIGRVWQELDKGVFL